MTPQQIRNEVEKGCGKKFRWKGFYCGAKYPNKNELMFCPTCQAKLSILTEYDKSIKEIIEKINDPEIIANWGKTPQERLVILKYVTEWKKLINEELLSRIGDNSEVTSND